MESTDQKIIHAVLSGETEAYASLVQATQGRVYRFCLLLLSNPTDADDAAQETFIKAFKALKTFHGKSSFSTWVCHIAHNLCMDKLRKKTRQKTDSLDGMLEHNSERLNNALSEHEIPEESPIDYDMLKHSLASMRPEYREILVLREISELSYDQIAKNLKCSLDAVKARLRRARHELQDKARHFMSQQPSIHHHKEKVYES
jgi:RNA polymerase sigma-70 factor, ECF subfamily